MGSENAPVLEVSKDGLSVLVNPDRPVLDIVFVHGFTGHPERTWSHKGGVRDDQAKRDGETCEPQSKRQKLLPPQIFHSRKTELHKAVYWPRDLLPATLPNARILTYGYDTHISHWIGPRTSRATIYDIAWDLVVRLEAERRSGPSRPLLFIAHSLGGIIVKEALRRSYNCEMRQSHVHSIYESTSGIFFFGTPHGGADPRGLILNIATKAMKGIGFSVNEQIVDALLPSSERLRELRDEFGPMARQKNWIIYSFQEQYGISALNGNKVVDDTASCLNDLGLEVPQRIARNHMDMCRFHGLDDAEYMKVVGALDRVQRFIRSVTPLVARSALSADDRQVYLSSLRFDQIDARHATIKMAHTKTCKWLLTHSKYQDWLDNKKLSEHNGFLWIKGKPGTGKSTIMKFAHAHAKKNPTATIISFFFNARGDHLEKSAPGMYRSLTLQLLEKLPDLQNLLDAWGPAAPDNGDIREPHVERIKTLFHNAIENLGPRSLICFIDALDECEEDQVRGMVAFFERLGELAASSQCRFRVCFSSRHYPHITIAKGIQLVLDGQEGHEQDIANYLESDLKAGTGQRVEQIKIELRERASGIFLWVVLVVSILNKEYDHGRIHALQRRLNEIPSGLDELFQDMLTRDCQNMGELLLCLQWMLFARRPLKPEELYFAILAGVEPQEVTAWNLEDISKHDMERFILSSSKGLAEMTRSKDQTVQFIHESVRDFLLKGSGLNRLQSDFKGDFRGWSHERLKQCCHTYMMIDTSEHLPLAMPLSSAFSEAAAELRRLAFEKFPFLEYAVRNVMHHADTADQYGISQDAWLDRLCLKEWIILDNLFEKHQIRRHTSNASLLYILAERDLPRLIRIELKRVQDIDIRGERYGFPLFAAFANTNKNAIRELVKPDTSVDFDGNTPATEGDYEEAIGYLLRTGRDIDFKKVGSLLSWAAKHGNTTLVKILLATHKVDINFNNKKRVTPLSWAAMHGHEAVVRLLLAWADVEADSKDDLGRTPLSYAAINGHEAVVRLLLTRADVEVNSEDCVSRTPLLYAIMHGHEAVVRLLLARADIEANLKDYCGDTPLLHAAMHGYEAVVRLLLTRADVETDSKDNSNHTPLSHAAINGHEAVVRLLLARADVETDSKDDRGKTPLTWAAINGHEVVIRLLLARADVEADSKDDCGDTPLSYAVMRGHEAVVRLLQSKNTP